MKKFRITKSILLVAASGVLSTLASAATISGNTADAEVHADGTLGGVGNGTIYAGNYNNGLTNLSSAAFVFQLPTLTAGQSFSNSTLTFTVSALSGTRTYNGDLTGLTAVAASPTVLGSYYGATSTLLQSGILTPSSTTGSVVSTDISAFLNTAYNNGANAGQYVFLLVTTPNDPATARSGYILNTANSANVPTITYTASAVPEPSTYGLMGAGALVAAALVRRRRKVA